jgi:hypothetical protein
MRGVTSHADSTTANAKPTHITRRALPGPKRRFVRSVTRNANGYDSAPHVSQLLIGYCTRMFEAVTTTAMAAMPSATPRAPLRSR